MRRRHLFTLFKAQRHTGIPNVWPSAVRSIDDPVRGVHLSARCPFGGEREAGLDAPGVDELRHRRPGRFRRRPVTGSEVQ
jgi:hypothetical protein